MWHFQKQSMHHGAYKRRNASWIQGHAGLEFERAAGEEELRPRLVTRSTARSSRPNTMVATRCSLCHGTAAAAAAAAPLVLLPVLLVVLLLVLPLVLLVVLPLPPPPALLLLQKQHHRCCHYGCCRFPGCMNGSYSLSKNMGFSLLNLGSASEITGTI